MSDAPRDLGELVDGVLAPDRVYSYTQLAGRAGLDVDTLRQAQAAFGLPRVEDDDVRWDDTDLEVARGLERALTSGIPLDRLLELNRVIGRAAVQVAAASRELVAQLLAQVGGDEEAVLNAAERYVQDLSPLLTPTLDYAVRAHLREMVRSDVISAADISAGRTAGARDVAVAFADLVGFTKLGEQVPVEEVGEIVRRLEELAAGLVAPPVTFVKTLGDAVMLVAPEPDPLLELALRLVEEAEERELRLRVGVAFGAALQRAGDWYGSPVNQASRVTALARPGSVVATQSAKDRAGESWSFSFAGARKLRGVGEVPLHRVRRPS